MRTTNHARQQIQKRTDQHITKLTEAVTQWQKINVQLLMMTSMKQWMKKLNKLHNFTDSQKYEI
jgi:hypothetical protein